MPNRILKESICTSDSIDELSLFAETMFYRLIVNCDDYGRMDGREKILSARLFPLKAIDDGKIFGAICEMETAGLITVYYVNDRRYIQMKTWEKHQQVRARKSKYPTPPNIAADSISNQMIADDYKCPRNPIQSESEYKSESESESELPDAEAHAIQREHDKVLEAAHNAGLANSPTVNSILVNLYAVHGLEKMLNALMECATHNAPSIAYLNAVLSGSRKKQKPLTPFHNFEQRDEDLNESAKNDMAKKVAEVLAKKRGDSG